MLFRLDILEGIRAGKVTVAFRRWKRPTVREGGTLRTRAGVLAFDRVRKTSARAITDSDARRAGYASRAVLLAEIARWAGRAKGSAGRSERAGRRPSSER